MIERVVLQPELSSSKAAAKDAILAIDRLLKRRHRLAYMLAHDVAAKKLGGIVKAFLELADFVIGQRPVVAVLPANHSLMWRICWSAMISPSPGKSRASASDASCLAASCLTASCLAASCAPAPLAATSLQ